jgi:hypothetical protein
MTSIEANHQPGSFKPRFPAKKTKTHPITIKDIKGSGNTFCDLWSANERAAALRVEMSRNKVSGADISIDEEIAAHFLVFFLAQLKNLSWIAVSIRRASPHDVSFRAT